jgi:hypothetical protein
MNFQPTYGATGVMSIQRERVSALLSRYPRVTEQEAREILDFLRTGRHLDVGLLTSDEALRPKLDAFMEEYKAHFRVGFGEAAAVIAGIVALMIVLWLAWEYFG